MKLNDAGVRAPNRVKAAMPRAALLVPADLTAGKTRHWQYATPAVGRR